LAASRFGLRGDCRRSIADHFVVSILLVYFYILPLAVSAIFLRREISYSLIAVCILLHDYPGHDLLVLVIAASAWLRARSNTALSLHAASATIWFGDWRMPRTFDGASRAPSA
jgi:hypothetical protein